MGKINWKEKITNEGVSRRINDKRELVGAIRQMKTNWTRHILREDCTQNLIIEGKIAGKKVKYGMPF